MFEHDAQLQQEYCKYNGAIFDLEEQHRNGLKWWPSVGIGYYPVIAGLEPYNQAYFDRFARDAKTELGRALMQARVNFVEQHFRGTLIDVGIGCGAFIELRSRRRSTYGYDVNPAGLQWLAERKILVDPYLVSFDAMTMWDVLEHIVDFAPLLANVRQWLFLSLPIFRDFEHALNSKHFRPDEHVWYFSRDGLIYAMNKSGFEFVSENSMESELGREDIGTFAFKRISDGRL